MQWGYVLTSGTGVLIRVEGKRDGANKYRSILEENLYRPTGDFRQRWRFTF